MFQDANEHLSIEVNNRPLIRKSFVGIRLNGCREPVPGFLLVTHLSLDRWGYMCPPVCTPNRLKSPIERLIQTKLPHTIVSALSGLSLSHIKNLRETLIENGLFLPKTSVQKRHLERHSFDRFVLFVAICYFDLQLYLGHSPIESYLNTIHVFDHAPTVLANKSEECHLAVNLYHWLTAHGKLSVYGENFQISSPEHFPENFRDLFDFRTLSKVPAIREMGTFSIPECLDLEHERLLETINQAILQKKCLKTVLHNYFEGRYA